MTLLPKPQRSYPSITRQVLLLNGIGDIGLGLGLLLASELFASMLSFQYTPEMQYLAGGWGIATIALGGWRIVASRSNNIELFSTTVIFGLFEGGLLSLFEVALMVSGRLSSQQVSLGLVFSSVFAIAYALCIIKSRVN